MLYWAKGVATREAVRMAIGQLPDYSPGTNLAVLLPTLPMADLIELLPRHDIRCVYEAGPGDLPTSRSRRRQPPVRWAASLPR